MKKTLLSVPCILAIVLLQQAYTQEANTPWQLPRTKDGHPDLQGVWSNATQLPLQRPEQLGEKRAYTAEEAAAREARAALAAQRNNSPSDPNRSAPSDGNVAAAYNTFWLDRGNGSLRQNASPINSHAGSTAMELTPSMDPSCKLSESAAFCSSTSAPRTQALGHP